MTLILKVTFEEMALATSVFLDEHPDRLQEWVNKDIKTIPEIMELFRINNWDIDYYRSLHEAAKSDLEDILEDIATTLMSLGYSKDIIAEVLDEYIRQNPDID
jgi:uncharacterized protein YjaG (DUF416 family)